MYENFFVRENFGIFARAKKTGMREKILCVICILWLTGLSAAASGDVRFRLTLADKQGTTGSLSHPEKLLSPKALERRAKQGLRLDSTDLPVSKVYVEQILATGVRLVTLSKWNNTVVVEADSEAMGSSLAQLPFVLKVKKVWERPEVSDEGMKDRRNQITDKNRKVKGKYGAAGQQIKMHRGEQLHEAGFRGEGMDIAVIDAGFLNTDAIGLFENIRLKGSRDFVNPHSDIFGEHSHGTKVLSCMAADASRMMVGTAPEANYWLLRSEDNATEQPIEEDYWVAAVEFADSVGVDIVNTSLGYYEFDDPTNNYLYRELDGHTSPMSAAASLMAGKGMLLVCSAGNSGKDSWKKITPPADAEHILSVGAVSADGINADFSSIGNTADNRIKPEVMAVGFNASIVNEFGVVSLANGTSFSAPVFCGLVACLWQACPWLTAYQLIELVLESGDRSSYPDNIYGYGIPDIWECYQQAQKLKK